ncbi:MAG: hypothetical protein PHF86_05190 [Candidatus Nanoarchaeia archaeon]|jgi:hypothetical protein|nr:hypothetical protein [Candidatus Nanoarchaeia archaeon]
MTVSTIEIQNASIVLGMLCDIEGIAYNQTREDIFEVRGPEGFSCLIDVEPTLVCIASEICDVPEDESKQFLLFKYLLELNHQAVHGKFSSDGKKVYFKENLEIANLDLNELEAALGWTLGMVKQGVEKISTIVE